MLVKVRTRGRPSPMDIRKVILVDTDSQVVPENVGNTGVNNINHFPSKHDQKKVVNCPKMNKQPILYLRAIKKQKALLVDGILKIMVEDNSIDDIKKFKFVSEREFLLEHGDIKDKKSKSEITYEKCPIKGSFVELFTHEGVFLSTECSCDDNTCICDNCLIHRKEEELNTYIEESGVPLTNLGSGCMTDNTDLIGYNKAPVQSNVHECNNSLQDYVHPYCFEQPVETVSMNKILLYGIINIPLSRKSVIVYKGRLIHSSYWWDFIKLQLPIMNNNQLESIDLLTWFDNILSTYNSLLPHVNSTNYNPDSLLGHNQHTFT